MASAYLFDDYVLIPAARSLLRNGQHMRLRPREFDVLVELVRAAGTVVPRDTLLQKIWRSSETSDANLRVQISHLRKMLAEDKHGRRYIDSVPGKGYSFVQPVQHTALLDNPRQIGTPPARRLARMAEPARLFGRADLTEELVRLVQAKRFVTLVGTGGAGKTAVARAVAVRLTTLSGIALQFIDLATDANLASAPGQSAELQACPLRQSLIVIDHCEFDLDRAIELAGELSRRQPHSLVLAVSRHALQVRNETMFQLPPLAMPPRGAALSLQEARQFPAVQLFCERGRACHPTFALTDQDVPELIQLCHALDGLPLALELAASCSGLFNLAQLLTRCHTPPAQRRPCAKAQTTRQHTMWASLDWTFGKLGATEQAALCQLATLRHTFGFSAICAALAACGIPASSALATMQALVAASLIVVEHRPDCTLYRLLNSTKAYALERHRERGPARALADLATGAEPALASPDGGQRR